jgi:hypothetical protein
MTVVRPWLRKLSEAVQETVIFSRPAGIQLIVRCKSGLFKKLA